MIDSLAEFALDVFVGDYGPEDPLVMAAFAFLKRQFERPTHTERLIKVASQICQSDWGSAPRIAVGEAAKKYLLDLLTPAAAPTTSA